MEMLIIPGMHADDLLISKQTKPHFMKRILLLALLGFLNYGAFAQAGSLTVENTTSCTVYYVIRGDRPGTCGATVMSSFIALAPGASINYASSAAVPGFPSSPTLFLSRADLYPRPVSCRAPDTHAVGEPCSGWGPMASYPVYSNTCALCLPVINVQWLPAPGPGGPAVLKFN
jgi:hypothetical protein